MAKLKKSIKNKIREKLKEVKAPKELIPPVKQENTTTSSKFQNPLDLKNSVAFVSGKRGSGKTELCHFLSTGDHSFAKVKEKSKFPFVIVYDPRYQVQAGTVVSTIDDFIEAVRKSKCKGIITYSPRDPRAEFPAICRILRDVPFEDTLFFVDEVSMVCDPHNIPIEFQDLIRYGRHNRIAIIMTAQRPKDVNRDLTAQCNHLFLFRQHEPSDIDYFSGFLGSNAHKAKSLEDFSFLYSDFSDKIFIVDKNLSLC